MTSKEKRSCEAAQKAARTLTAMKIQDPRYKQSRSSDVPIFTLSADPTAEDFIRFYDASKERSRNICPFSITAKLKDGTPVKIPVTPAMPDNVEDRTYHIVALTRSADGAIVQLLVEEFSGYVKALRVILEGDDPDKVKWCTLCDELLPKRFGPVIRTEYGVAHGELADVKLGKGTVPEIFEFLLTFKKKPHQEFSDEGRLIFTVLFVLIAEGRRFWIVENWVVTSVKSFKRKSLPAGFPTLIRDWSGLSKCSFWLYLAILEEVMEFSVPDDEKKTAASMFAKTWALVLENWKESQRVHKETGMIFYEEGIDPKLDSLVGGELYLLKHDYELCDKILMRSDGYFGRWMTDIQKWLQSQ